MSEYPAWLAENLLSVGLFRWDKAQKTDLPGFLAKYNLHDSYWFGLYISPGDQATAIIQWDIGHPIYQYPDLFSKDVWGTYKWPFLLINFYPPPHQILFSGDKSAEYRANISFASSKIVSAQDRDMMLNLAITQSHLEDRMKDFYLNDDLCQTIIEIIGGEIHLFHDAEKVEFLCMNWDGEILEIPGI
ncbi:MAG: hypothetical protein ABI690_04440 [Chloroflexota bacterium]